MASRIFLGLPLCRDDAWLHLTKEITVNVFLGATMINIFPPPLRRFVHWFQPHCRKVRQQTVEGRRLIKKVTQDRQNLKDAARAAGQSPPELHDALEWAEQEAAAKGIKYDPAQFQFALSSAAMHTTTDLLTQCILELAHHPEIIAPLREEISRVLKTEGWKKSALYNMKLLDSVIKESLRMQTPHGKYPIFQISGL
jgi:cytochrome P450